MEIDNGDTAALESSSAADSENVSIVLLPVDNPSDTPLREIEQLSDRWALHVHLGRFYGQISWSELSGSCGDLGTFLPLLCAMGQAEVIYPGPALLYAGVANIIAGVLWNCPMPVQPMKSIAATALFSSTTASMSTSSTWTASTVTASGLWMGIFMVVIGIVPSLMDTIQWLVPRAVVSGVQLGVGCALAIHGLQQWQGLPFVGFTVETCDCILLAILCGVLTLLSLRPRPTTSTPQTPIALILFALASVLAILRLQSGNAPENPATVAHVSWWGLRAWKLISKKDLLTGFWEGALPQLPLTLLNSVISLCCLADSLFPERRRRPQQPPLQPPDSNDPPTEVLQPRHVALSVGCLNLLACPLGAMPVCHGAGGLAGQYTFGARYGTSIIVLGIVKMMVAVITGPEYLLVFLQALPLSILGVLLMVAGHELALTGLSSIQSEDCGDAESRRHVRTELSICLWTALVIIGLHKTHYGALMGSLAYILYYKVNVCWS